MGRPPCCDKANVKRGPWTPEEDAKILAYVASHGIGNWTLVPQKAGLNRCGKSCRLRWTNYLRPDLKHDNFTAEEEECIIELHKQIGSRWSLIARRLPGRTDNDVKNYWNTKLKKKLTKLGIDPITHKPFSQLLSEYRKISGFPRNRSINDVMVQKCETENQFQVMHFSKEASSADSFSSSSNGPIMQFGCNYSSKPCEPSKFQLVPASSSVISNSYFSSDPSYSDNIDVQLQTQEMNCETAQFQELGFLNNLIVDQHKSKIGGSESREAERSSDPGRKVNGGSENFSPGVALFPGDSFVESIFAHDNEMRICFPNILDDEDDYDS